MVEAEKDSKEKIIAQFKALKDARDLSILLGIKHASLTYWIYRASEGRKYKTFTILKKDGSDRHIKSPQWGLRYIQGRLRVILECVYDASDKPAHGFIKTRSVVSNAEQHVGKKHVFNIDLLDFFPSINFGRVRGMFMKWPYSLPAEVASVMAQIVVSENQLPQGAPTSPIISNMLCSKLDKSLSKLASRNHCQYSRYADDITFSTNRSIFPRQIMTEDEESGCKAGDGLVGIIEAHVKGFKINHKKTRVHRQFTRQEVTGLVVNEKVNLKREYIRQVRAMLHAWDKYGLGAAQKEFNKKYSGQTEKELDFDNVVRGKLAYIKMVRGSTDALLRKYVDQYNKLTTRKKIELPPEDKEILRQSSWVVETPSLSKQGSAFNLEDIGFITCEHVLGDDSFIFHPDDPTKKFLVKIIKSEPAIDLAIIEASAPLRGHLQPVTSDMKEGQRIIITGYPHYKIGDQLWVIDGKVNGFTMQSGIKRSLVVGANIIAGMSGGAVVNTDYKVVGIAVRGAPGHDEANDTARHEVIPISAIEHLLKK